MIYLKRKDIKRRNKFLDEESKSLLLKSFIVNDYINSEKRVSIRNFFYRLSIHGTKLNNRCVYTGRSRGVLRSFKSSRLVVKRQSLSGMLVGVRKSTW